MLNKHLIIKNKLNCGKIPKNNSKTYFLIKF